MIPRWMQTEEVIDRALEAYTQTISGDIQTLALLLGLAVFLFIVLAIAVTYVMFRIVRNVGDDQKGSNSAIMALAQTLAASVSQAQAQTNLSTQQLHTLQAIERGLLNDLPGKLAAQIKTPLSQFEGKIAELVTLVQGLPLKLEAQGSAIELQIRKNLEAYKGAEARQIVAALGEWQTTIEEGQTSINTKLDMIIELLANQQEGKDDRYASSDNVVSRAGPGDGRDGAGDDDTHDGLG